MVKLNRIYTKTGDQGTTALGDGSRLPKHALRIEGIGAVDEANAFIGLARYYMGEAGLQESLARIQNDLFDLGADLCLPIDRRTHPTLRVTPDQVARLEAELDQLNDRLAPLTSFVLPGGSAASAYLHVARTVVRRAERQIVALHTEEPVNGALIQYLNRLSDYLFVAARYTNDLGQKDVLWQPGQSQKRE